MDVAFARGLDDSVHVARFPAVRERKFIFRGSQPERADHHRRERVGEFALEHRAFARNNAVIPAHVAKEERRVHIGKINLPGTFEVALGAVETLRHHAEVNVIGAQNMANLAQHLLDANVAARVARPIVARKQQLEFFARSPALAKTQHPADAPDLDQCANPGDEQKIRHEPAPLAVGFAATSALAPDGHGFAG